MLHSTQHLHSNMDIVQLRKQRQTEQGHTKMQKVNIGPIVPNCRQCGNTIYVAKKMIIRNKMCTFQCKYIFALRI